MTRGEERQGADTENSEKSAATTPANHIDIVYFNENSLKNKIIKFHRKRGGRSPLGQPLNRPMKMAVFAGY